MISDNINSVTSIFTLSLPNMKKCYSRIFLAVIFSFAITVLHAQSLFLTGTSADPTCDGAANGSIAITATGGLQPYTYSIDGITFQNSNVYR